VGLTTDGQQLAHCLYGSRPSWRPVVGVVLPPLWTAEEGPGSGGRTSPIARARVVGASEMATGVVVGAAVILPPGRRRGLSPRRSPALEEASVLDAPPPRYGGCWWDLGVGRLFGGRRPRNPMDGGNFDVPETSKASRLGRRWPTNFPT
jgi:hypothetical protein